MRTDNKDARGSTNKEKTTNDQGKPKKTKAIKASHTGGGQEYVAPKGFNKRIFVDRSISLEELNKIDMTLQPGFQIKWNYNVDIKEPIGTLDKGNSLAREFRR